MEVIQWIWHAIAINPMIVLVMFRYIHTIEAMNPITSLCPEYHVWISQGP